VNNTLFFNTGWSGPSPKRVVDEQKRVMERLASEGVSHHIYGELNKDLEALRSRLASFLGTSADEIALTRSTTEAINVVLGGIDWQAGQKVVTTNVEHGAGLVPVYNVRDRYGIEVEIVDLRDGRDVLRKLERAIDDRTRLVSVSHVSFNTGLRLPLRELAEIVAERGTELLVDGAQAVGVFRVDLHEIGCDYYAFPGHKWMLGPDAVGALYVRGDRMAALEISFAGNETALDFDREGHVAYHSSARKFEMCDFNAALISGWIKALDFIEEFGMGNVESAIGKNAAYLKKKLSRVDRVRVATPTEWTKSAGLVAIGIEGMESKDAFDALLARDIIVRYTPSPSLLRISVNFFNTPLELDRLVDAIRELSGS
jgi:L-cysteine/cystine lyase